MWPHSAPLRRCNHHPPRAKHSTQPVPLGLAVGLIPSLSDFMGFSLTSFWLFDGLDLNRFSPGLQDWFQIWFVCGQVGMQRRDDLGALADRSGNALHGF